ncbi:uncharacterized protein [Procambarus clarkii]|uniref:uncharacterized protein n=1 Tax=Procambarus clarkii TaxID=6728 RepID=UPI003743CF6B
MKLRIWADRFTTNDKEACEELNYKFQQVFTLEQGEVPEISQGIINQAPLEEFEITSGVRMLLLESDVTKAIGPDGMSPWILKEGAEALCLTHSMVYNKSLKTGELPEIWKRANVVPIYKKGDREETLNYKASVPNLHTMQANGENCAKKASGTSGAKELCVTTPTWFQGWQVMPRRINYILRSGNKKEKPLTQPHQRLVRKLEMQAGVNGKVFHWIREYLSNRRKRVTVQGEVSDWRDVTTGV